MVLIRITAAISVLYEIWSAFRTLPVSPADAWGPSLRLCPPDWAWNCCFATLCINAPAAMMFSEASVHQLRVPLIY